MSHCCFLRSHTAGPQFVTVSELLLFWSKNEAPKPNQLKPHKNLFELISHSKPASGIRQEKSRPAQSEFQNWADTPPSIWKICLAATSNKWKTETKASLLHCGRRERESSSGSTAKTGVLPFPFYRHHSSSSKQVGVRFKRIRQQQGLSAQFVLVPLHIS